MPTESIYGYPIRQPTQSEQAYFAKNPHVAGMAAEDRKIILNPTSPLSASEKQAVARNEAARLWMRDNKIVPTFAVTPEQRAQFKGTAYADPKNALQLKQTIISRILTGDPSAGATTAEQEQWAERVRRQLPAEALSGQMFEEAQGHR